MPNGKKKKGHKMATHKRKKRLRKNRHKSKEAVCGYHALGTCQCITRSYDMPFVYRKEKTK